MKTKAIAISLMFTFTAGSIFAATPAYNNLASYQVKDTVPTTTDTVPTEPQPTDSMPTEHKTDTTAFFASNNMNANLLAYNSQSAVRDTVPTDTIPADKKDTTGTDTTLALNAGANANLLAFNFVSVRDTVPTDTIPADTKDTTTTKDSTLAFNSAINASLVAFNFMNTNVRDTVPTDTIPTDTKDTTTTKDSTLALNSFASIIMGKQLKTGSNAVNYYSAKGNLLKSEPVEAILSKAEEDIS